MTIDNIQNLVEEFVKRLQLPEAHYSFSVANSNDFVELIISVDNAVNCSLSIGNGTIKVLYSDDYDSDKYVSLNFLTPVSLLYQLCVFFFAATSEVISFNFNDLLKIILFEDNMKDWKDLAYALCENLMLSCEIGDGTVNIEGTEIRYIPYLSKIIMNDTEIELENNEYSTVADAIFKCVEYIANLAGVADDLFQIEEEEDNMIPEEGEMEEEGMPPMGGGDMDINVDVGEGPGGEETEPVEPMENETFEEPQGPVVTMDDLIE